MPARAAQAKGVVCIRHTPGYSPVTPVRSKATPGGVPQGSLWEGAVSQRLTEGESPGFFDAVSYEALVIDQRSLPQSASRPAPSQREPLVLPLVRQFINFPGSWGRKDCQIKIAMADTQVTIASTWLTRKVPQYRLSIRRPSIQLRPRPYQAA